MNDLIKLVEAENAARRAELPEFSAGDTLNVHVKIREGNKERIQVFQGTVIQRRNSGAGETFTVRKISNGVGVERIFLCCHQTSTKSKYCVKVEYVVQDCSIFVANTVELQKLKKLKRNSLLTKAIYKKVTLYRVTFLCPIAKL
jgi:ribosomal protein L19